jgi:alginate O-acetyltransferase complex protein AlgI
MLFCSKEFVRFFLAVFALYWMLPWHRARVWLLLAASFTFYAYWNKQLALLVSATTVADFFIALSLDRLTDPRRRRLLLALSLVMNIGLLCYFKYTNFFLSSLHEAFHHGDGSVFQPLKILLPVGISFYTFEAISYTLDVYWRRIRAERSLEHFMLFILFFPHLIAGPIVRGRDFLPQVARRKRWSWPRLHLGLQLFILGMFKKLAIADRMALYADPVFAQPEAFRSSALWLAALAYAIQIYCDFSGYSDMAIGCAHMLGYKLLPNFDMPYLSANAAEFWHRWHISLSTWLRDYLFIPLGGSRGGRWQTCRNLLITMTLGGLWHGASWCFILWGAAHGAWLSLHRLFRGWCEPRPRLRALLGSVPGRTLCVAGTFAGFLLTWVLFRATTLSKARTMLRGMLLERGGSRLPLTPMCLVLAVIVVVVCHLLARTGLWRRLVDPLPSPVRGLGYALVMVVALVLAPDTGTAFIYFQF